MSTFTLFVGILNFALWWGFRLGGESKPLNLAAAVLCLSAWTAAQLL